MALTKYKLGEFVELYSERCGIPNLTVWDISGVNSDKEFFEPSKQAGEDTSNYKKVPPNYFACNLMHVGRDCVLPVGLNHTDRAKIVSPAYTIFKIKEGTPLLREYFYIMLKSDEQDRYFWFHTDASVRDGMSWEDFCDLEVELPSLKIQQKYVDVYNAMVANQQSYERGLDDLKMVCDAYIEELRREMPCERIGQFIIEKNRRNEIGLDASAVRGISTNKELIPTKADMNGVGVANYKLVEPGQITYVPDTSRRGDKISLAMNTTVETFLVSSISTVFDTKRERVLPEYLMLFFTRAEFDRYARYNSWGSAREAFDWDAMCDFSIPIPDMAIQMAISEIYAVYYQRKTISGQLKAQIKELCPILIKGSIEEARQ